ncbi:MAG: AI-2E family transporter [Armatimonadetes bacterium]|nr:AI-2E family transporter [Armatimonadota bacterium]MDW8122538.1 AI-2E family transporter [Armatimonadota bacterium]
MRRIGYGLVALLTLIVLWKVRSVLSLFLLGIFLAYLLDPLVDRLEEKGFSRAGASRLVFLSFFLIGFGLGILLVPTLIEQSVRLAQSLLPPEGKFFLLLTDLLQFIEKKTQSGELPPIVNDSLQNLMNQLGQYLIGYLKTALSTVTSLLSLILLPFITYYALQIVDPLRERLRWWIPEEYRTAFADIIRQSGAMVGRYIRGYLFLCVAVGITDTLFLYACRVFFGIDYVLTVGILAGAAYAIPYFGMAVVTVTAGIVAGTTATSSPAAAVVIVVIGLLGVNQFFDWVLLPRVVGEAVRLHPLTVIFAVMAGGSAFGVLGMILAVPFAGAAKLILIHLFPRHFGPVERIKGSDTIKSQYQVSKAEG